MNKHIIIAAIAAAMLTGCGSAAAQHHQNAASSPLPGVTVSATSSPQTSSDARLLLDALAGSDPASLLSARSQVAGPVITDYLGFQTVQAEAYAAQGQPETPQSVIANGAGSYQLCDSQNGCQSFTAFATDSSGRVTGMDVDGQRIEGRLAAGPSDTGNGLVLTDVTSYLYTSSGQVGVAYRVRNTGNSGVSSMGFLPVFVTSGGAQLQPDLSASVMQETAALPPGQSRTEVAVFDTRVVTGTFILQSNGGYQALVSSRLVKVS